jgi:transposase
MKTTQISDPEILRKENEELRCENSVLKEQIAWFKRQIFGQKSERIVPTPANQLMLDGFDQLETSSGEPMRTIPAHQRRKPKRNGQDAISLPSDLPIKTTVLDIPENEKVCKETGEPLVKIGEEVTHKLAHEPGSYYIKKIVRPKYANSQKPEEGVTTALLPDSIIPKCRADESLLAEIVTKKFVDHMPLYRIAEEMRRSDISISYKLLSQWVVRIGMALKLLYEAMTKKIIEGENVYIDETPVKLWEPKKCKTAYMWVIVGGKESNPAYRVYNFREDRRHDNALEILKNYHGVLHSDKYGAYVRLAEQKIVTWCPCFGHIRRKFVEAEGGDPPFRNWVLRKIRYLFMLERVAWARSSEERLQIRQEKEAPVIDELIQQIKERLIDGKLLPKSKFREALGYFCSLIPYLKNYTKYPFARLDNNVAERAIRPLAIGRKNWLFFGSPEGGESGAVLLSLVQTCRGLGINPRVYLEDIFRRFMEHPANRIDELLPDQWLAARQTAIKQDAS